MRLEVDLDGNPEAVKMFFTALANENKRLRDALTLIAEHPVVQSEQWRSGCFEMIRLADRALSGEYGGNPNEVKS